MPTEIEAKIKVPDLAAVRTTLQAAGATRIASELETNSFFDTPDRSLQSSDKGLRLRIAVDETGKSRCTVTMKGPLQKARFKTREETEFSADDSRQICGAGTKSRKSRALVVGKKPYGKFQISCVVIISGSLAGNRLSLRRRCSTVFP